MTGELEPICLAAPMEAEPLQTTHGGLLNRSAQMAGLAGRWTRRAALMGGGAYLALHMSDGVSGPVGPSTVQAKVTMGSGDISGKIPPVRGAITVNDLTVAPVGLDFTLSELGEDTSTMVRTELADFNSSRLLDSTEDQLVNLGERAVKDGAWNMLLGAWGGLAVSECVAFSLRRNISREGWRLPSRTQLLRYSALGGLPFLALGGTGAAAFATYNEDALKTPRFSGTMNEIAAFANSTIDALDRYQETGPRFTQWLDNLLAIQQNLGETTPLPTDNLLGIFLAADEHSAPCTNQMAQSIIKSFGVHMAFKAGDMAEWGQPFEPVVFNEACPDDNSGILGVPVMEVAGNHDRPELVNQSNSYPNVTSLNGEVVEQVIQVGDQSYPVRVLGDADPTYTADFSQRPEPEEEYQLICDLGSNLAKRVAGSEVDFVVVHNPAAARQMRKDLAGVNEPWIIAGHTHRFEIDEDEKIITLGSFGGAGLRGYERAVDDEKATRQAAVLYVDPQTMEPVMLYDIRIQRAGNASVNTHYFNNEPASPDNLATNTTRP